MFLLLAVLLGAAFVTALLLQDRERRELIPEH
jgi:hypothetical protein